jgi:transcriptional regulator with XRE-family HTH domain
MLKELRQKNKVTQSKLATLLGAPQSYVSKYEIGERRLDLIETLEICRALNTDFVAFIAHFAKRLDAQGKDSPTRARQTHYGQR